MKGFQGSSKGHARTPLLRQCRRSRIWRPPWPLVVRFQVSDGRPVGVPAAYSDIVTGLVIFDFLRR
jgi:hypothetical protein